MSFWGTVGKVAKVAANVAEAGSKKMIELSEKSKEIQQNEMVYKSDEELRRLLTCSPQARRLAAVREFRERGLSK